MAWMAVLEAPPPPSVSMPEAKKARRAMVPRGVRTYLRAIAREMVDSCRPSSAGDLAQGQRAQRLFAELQEPGLLRAPGSAPPAAGFPPRDSRPFSSQRASCRRPRR